MTQMLIDSSRYVLVLMMALYTYGNFRYFGVREEKKKILWRRQNILMFCLHALAYLVLFLGTEDWRLPVFYVVQAVFFWCYLFVFGRLYPNRSAVLAGNLCLFLCVGFLILTRLSFAKALRQFLIVVFGAAVTLTVPFIMERAWQLAKIPWLYAALGLGLLLAVYWSGNKSYGAQLSLTIKGLTVQPSEFVKISFVFFAAAMFYRSVERRQIAAATVTAGLHVLVLAISKDLGSALLFFVTYVCMVFVATSDRRYLAAGLMIGCLAAIAAWALFAHVRVRVAVWENPWADIDNRGYQITQSLFAIGTGGWFGMGLYGGMPNKIPVVEKDFVFAALCEELGVLFALCVVLICLGCFIQFMMLACRMKAMFYKLIAVGLGIMYIAQVFLTVGGATKFIPSTGVTFPFISYGGSSVVSTFLMFSVIQGIYSLKSSEEEEEAYEAGM